MRFWICLLLLLYKIGIVLAADPILGKPTEFVMNKGQWAQSILFTAQLPQGWLFLEKAGLTYNFLEKDYFNTEADTEKSTLNAYKAHAIRLIFVNANINTQIKGQEKLTGYRNYFIGNKPAEWATEVPAFKETYYQNLFNLIDLRVYTLGGHLKYDFVLAPQGQVSDIKMKYEGLTKIALRNQRLYLSTSVNEIMEEKPYAYQLVGGVRQEIACAFTLTDQTVGFKITGPYDQNLPLIIDPEIIFMTYAGANAGLSANCATADAAGNTYIASRTMGPIYPVTTGAYQTTRRGNNTGISKFNEAGTALVYATFLGGAGLNNDEYPLALAVNKQNELIILGHTNANDFPTSSNAYDRTYNESRDYFVSRLSANGTALQASTYLGGSGQESGGIGNTPAQLALDGAGNVFVAGCTQSADFKILNGFQSVKKGGYDGVVVKLNSGLTNVLWSSFIGGNAEEMLYDIKVGASGKIYIGGSTTSPDFPNTHNTLNPDYLGNRDGFVAIISAAGDKLETATYVGTAQTDLVKYVQVDKDENLYATGFTTGSYPIAPADTYGTPNSGGGYFIHKLNSSLRNTIFSTHLGSNTGLSKVPTAFRVNACGTIYLAGFALTNSPLSIDAQERNRKTMYVCQLTKDAKKLIYGSYLGGSDNQPHTHLANTSYITEGGILYQIECTYARDQPVTAGAYDPIYFNSPDAAVIKYQFSPYTSDLIKALAATPPPSCAPYQVQFSNTSENAISYNWNFGDGSAPVTELNPTHLYQKAGNYRVRLIVGNPTSCKTLDTTFVNVVVAPPPVSVLPRQTLYLCSQRVNLDAGNTGYNFLWSNGATTQIITVTEPGEYKVQVSLGNCQFSDSVLVNQALPGLEVPNIITPNKDGKNDFFIIRNSGANTKLQVYNRWGNLIYRNDNYLNTWDGQNLTQGTYYYVIQSESNCVTKKGWFEIVQ